MGKKVAPYIKEICQKYNIDPKEALWDCHGTWVMYHRFIEQVAANAKIETWMERVIRSESKDAVIMVSGEHDGRKEWSFGEAAPHNNKNSYTWAMAEKRGKDRVILKLIGLSGHVYSEEEADDFKPKNQAPPKDFQTKEKMTLSDFTDQLHKFTKVESIQAWEETNVNLFKSSLSLPDQKKLRSAITRHTDKILEGK
jgi:hypothetical protein